MRARQSNTKTHLRFFCLKKKKIPNPFVTCLFKFQTRSIRCGVEWIPEKTCHITILNDNIYFFFAIYMQKKNSITFLYIYSYLSFFSIITCWNYCGLHDHMKLISTILKVHDQSHEPNVFTFPILHI